MMFICERAGSDPHYHFPILLDSSRFEDFRSKDRDINSEMNVNMKMVVKSSPTLLLSL